MAIPGPSTPLRLRSRGHPRPEERPDGTPHAGPDVRCGEAGAASSRVLGPLLVLLLVAYVGWVVVPPLWGSFQLRRAMQEETLYGPLNESPSLIQSRLLSVAQGRGLPVDRQEIRVEKRGAHVRVEAAFTIPVDFGAGLVWRWRQEPSYEGTRRPPAAGGS